MKRIAGPSLILAALLVLACGRAKKNECSALRQFFFAEVHWQGAPRQADMSQAAQAENWKWRTERASERATGAGALSLQDPTLVSIRKDLVEYYTALASEARLTSQAWQRGDNAGLNQHAAAFDKRMNDNDALLKRIDDTCR